MKIENKIKPSDFLREHPNKKEYKNIKTGKAIKACWWGKNVEITFWGTKYSKTGNHTVGLKTKLISKDEFDRKYYLHDNAI